VRREGKGKVTVEYEGWRPVRVHTVLISAQHADSVDIDTLLRPDIVEHVIRPMIPPELWSDDVRVLVNPTGRFVIGGPQADTGLTGRKIVVDTYGGMARVGGGCFSGKDPTKVDRTGAYAARNVAKHVVASGAASRCEVGIAYAIGTAHPISIAVDSPVFALDRPFDYTIPARMRERVDVGSVVRVPLHGRRVRAYVTELLELPAVADPRPLSSLVSAEPLFAREQIELARWVADRYVTTMGTVLHDAVPGRYSAPTPAVATPSRPAERPRWLDTD